MSGASPADWGCLKLKHSCSIWCLGTALPAVTHTRTLADSMLVAYSHLILVGFEFKNTPLTEHEFLMFTPTNKVVLACVQAYSFAILSLGCTLQRPLCPSSPIPHGPPLPEQQGKGNKVWGTGWGAGLTMNPRCSLLPHHRPVPPPPQPCWGGLTINPRFPFLSSPSAPPSPEPLNNRQQGGSFYSWRGGKCPQVSHQV